jgi:thiol-disulfide isomerase/thioredoxin
VRHTIGVLVLGLGYTTLLTGCSRSNNSELAQARSEAQAAKAEGAAAKSELAKLRSEAPMAQSPATTTGAQPALAQDEANAAEPVLRVGRPAPSLNLKTLLQAPADAPTTLDQLKGKAVVLEFWGTWCAPCIAAFPHLNELVKDNRGEPVVFIAITDEPADRVAAFLEKKSLATWVGIDDRGATTMGYGIRSWPTTVLIDPDGVVRGVTTPDGVTAAMLKDLANCRPLKLREEDLPRLRTDKGGGIDLGQADFLVYLGPPNTLFGNPMVGPNESRTPRCSARVLLQSCYREEAGGPFKSPRVVFECDIPDKDFSYAVRVPKGSGLSQFGLLRQALESSLGSRTRGDREHRDQDVLVLKHAGPAAPAKAGGNAALGARVMYPPNAIWAEGATLNYLCQWIESETKKPVLDETGLAGEYDWRMKVKSFNLDDLNATLKEIGLALTTERRKVPYIVVRRIDDPAGK